MSANSTPETLRMPYHYRESRFAYYYDCLASCNLNILRFKVLEIVDTSLRGVHVRKKKLQYIIIIIRMSKR